MTVQRTVERLLLLRSQILLRLLLVRKVLLLLQQVVCVFLVLLLLPNGLLRRVDLGADLGRLVLGYTQRMSAMRLRRFEGCRLTFPVVLKHGNDLVDDLDRGVTLALRLPDLLRVAATLLYEILNVEHVCGLLVYGTIGEKVGGSGAIGSGMFTSPGTTVLPRY